MIKLSLARENNNARFPFPDAVGLVKNFQLNNGRISFELHFYADETATKSISGDGLTPMMGDAVIARKMFSADVKMIEAYGDEFSELTPSEKLIECCYSWLATQKIF